MSMMNCMNCMNCDFLRFSPDSDFTIAWFWLHCGRHCNDDHDNYDDYENDNADDDSHGGFSDGYPAKTQTIPPWWECANNDYVTGEFPPNHIDIDKFSFFGGLLGCLPFLV